MTPFNDASAIGRLSPSSDGNRKGVWVTNFSAGQFLLAHEAGLRPLGQVMGTSVFSLGGSSSSSAVSGELRFLTGAYRDAQARAIARLQAEAGQLNADGVVGVRVHQAAFGDKGDGLFEFSLIGTAVKTKEAHSTACPPFLCSVSGDEYFLLKQAGWRAVGMAVGNCAYFAVPRYVGLLSGAVSTSTRSFERTEFSNAVLSARHLAMARMQSDAQIAGGEGIVGVRVRLQKMRGEEGMGIHYFASGTVIVRAASPPQAKNDPLPILVL